LFDDPSLGITTDAKEVSFVDINCHANGQRGSAKRVMRRYPIIFPWSTTFQITILDPIVTRDILEELFCIAGMVIGLGRFRPQNSGNLGRFELKALEWSADRKLAA
jgi:hypothetical protein